MRIKIPLAMFSHTQNRISVLDVIRDICQFPRLSYAPSDSKACSVGRKGLEEGAAGAGAADGNFERLVGIPIQRDKNLRIAFSRTHQTAAVAARPLTQQFMERQGL